MFTVFHTRIEEQQLVLSFPCEELQYVYAVGRQAKSWTQADLAKQICEKQTVVNEYESGKAVPNQQILAKMERALGIRLRGKERGQPLPQRQSKTSTSEGAAAAAKGSK